jgi:hypothetical protein
VSVVALMPVASKPRHVEPHMPGDYRHTPQFIARKADEHDVAIGVLLRPVRSYGQLREAINARRKQLGLTMLELDEKSGVHPGYSAKLICGDKKLWPDVDGRDIGSATDGYRPNRTKNRRLRQWQMEQQLAARQSRKHGIPVGRSLWLRVRNPLFLAASV